MIKPDARSWPVLFVSDELYRKSDEGEWLRGIAEELSANRGVDTVFCVSWSDARDIVFSREDFGTVLVDWESRGEGRRQDGEAGNGRACARFVEYLRRRNRSIPVLLLSDRGSIEAIPGATLELVSGVIWKLTDTVEFNAGRIVRAVEDYAREVMPPFFRALVEYVREYNFAWHTPGHMGGQGFLKSPAGTAFHRFFGENALRADLSISVPELGSLLDHTGVTGEAERFSARVFGADETWYVLNGTSTGNQVVWRSRVSPGDVCLLDRNCHKSLNHAMIITGAVPEYMVPLRNALGIIGPVDFRSVDGARKWAMAALTNSTYDGICYDAVLAAERLANAGALHFDEAWYAYAKFHPLYAGRFAMSLPSGDRLVFATHSTHKLLTAFSQASMIHARLPAAVRDSPALRDEFRDLFNESYMMHGSTSPQYSMVASLEVATKMMRDNGEIAHGDILEEAIELRRKVASIRREEEASGDWFFDMWQPEAVARLDTRRLMEDPGHWTLRAEDGWHGFDPDGIRGANAMLDPIKLTFLCPGVDVRGAWSERGVPAAVVTRYLGDRGIVCEKTDYYSFLLLNSLGTTKGKQGTLLAELFRFRALYEENAPLTEVFPELVKDWRARYGSTGLREHCDEMHRFIRTRGLLERMVESSRLVPDMAMIPADAYRAIVKGRVEFVPVEDIDPEKAPRTCAVMVVPYPPGIPLIMGGERIDARSRPVLDYLLARQDFERAFPGYEGDIHGVDREGSGEGLRFELLLVKE